MINRCQSKENIWSLLFFMIFMIQAFALNETYYLFWFPNHFFIGLPDSFHYVLNTLILLTYFFFILWITFFSAFDHIIYVFSKILNAYSPLKVVLHLRKKCCSSSWKTLVTGRFDWLQQECKVNIFLINIAPLCSLFDVLKLILSAELVSK